MSFGGGGSAPPPPPAVVQPSTVPLRTLTEVPSGNDKVRSFMDPAAAASFMGQGSMADPSMQANKNGRTILGGG